MLRFDAQLVLESPILANSPDVAAKLRVGVWLETYDAPAWVRSILGDVRGSEFLELCIVDAVHHRRDCGFQSDPFRGIGTTFFRTWSWCDYHMCKTRDDAFAVSDIRDEFNDAPRLELTQGEGDAAHFASLRRARLDVILYFGCDPPPVGLHDCATHGVWVPLDCATEPYVASPRLFWDRCRGDFVSEISVLKLEADGARRVLCRSVIANNLVSLYKTQNAVYWRIADLLLRCLAKLHKSGTAFLAHATDAPATTSKPRVPGNLQMAAFVPCWLARGAKNQLLDRVVREQWFLGIRQSNGGRCTSQFDLIQPPADRFYADPFVIEKNTKNYVFFEDFRYSSGKGVISFFCIDEEGQCSSPQVVLERAYHLSYPFLFLWEDVVYMLPETSANRTIEAYRAVEFPYRWELASVLMNDISALDSTIVAYGDKFWLFTGLLDPRSGTANELLLFFSDSPFGRWHSHPWNPVVDDVRRARPAGALLPDGQSLIRPAQDCSRYYGRAVVLNRVEVLSETEYRETPSATITADWLPGNRGTHTLNQSATVQVRDGRKRVPRWCRA